MPAKIEEDNKRIAIIATLPWIKKINDWRQQQPDPVNFSDAIRRLVEKGIETDRPARRKSKAA